MTSHLLFTRKNSLLLFFKDILLHKKNHCINEHLASIIKIIIIIIKHPVQNPIKNSLVIHEKKKNQRMAMASVFVVMLFRWVTSEWEKAWAACVLAAKNPRTIPATAETFTSFPIIWGTRGGVALEDLNTWERAAAYLRLWIFVHYKAAVDVGDTVDLYFCGCVTVLLCVLVWYSTNSLIPR